MVVPVLITSCQVSEKSNSGPNTAHRMIRLNARIKATGLPVFRVTHPEILLNRRPSSDSVLFELRFFIFSVCKLRTRKILPYPASWFTNHAMNLIPPAGSQHIKQTSFCRKYPCTISTLFARHAVLSAL